MTGIELSMVEKAVLTHLLRGYFHLVPELCGKPILSVEEAKELDAKLSED